MSHGRSTLGKDKFHGVQAKNQGLEQRIQDLLAEHMILGQYLKDAEQRIEELEAGFLEAARGYHLLIENRMNLPFEECEHVSCKAWRRVLQAKEA